MEVVAIGEPEPVEDTNPIPDQRRTPVELIDLLEPELERMAIRQTIEAFYERVRERRGHNRALVLRRCAASAFRVSESALTSARRFKPITRMRQTSMAIARALLDVSLPEIGRVFGNRDHTTVIHANHKMSPLVLDVFTEMYDGKSCPMPPEETPEQEDAGGR
jgi:hypothetical protein